MGLHARPAAVIARLLRNANCTVRFESDKASIDAKSILEILMLAAKQHTDLTIIAEGEDADKTINELVSQFKNGFGELIP